MSGVLRKWLNMTAREIGGELTTMVDMLSLTVMDKNGIPTATAKDALGVQSIERREINIGALENLVTRIRLVNRAEMKALWPQADWWLTGYSEASGKVELHFRIVEESDG